MDLVDQARGISTFERLSFDHFVTLEARGNRTENRLRHGRPRDCGLGLQPLAGGVELGGDIYLIEGKLCLVVLIRLDFPFGSFGAGELSLECGLDLSRHLAGRNRLSRSGPQEERGKNDGGGPKTSQYRHEVPSHSPMF